MDVDGQSFPWYLLYPITLVQVNRSNTLRCDFFDNWRSNNTDNQYNFTDIPMPNVKYDREKDEKYIEIDSIDLIRATPTKVRSGKKTFNEQLQIDTLLSIPFNRPPANL